MELVAGARSTQSLSLPYAPSWRGCFEAVSIHLVVDEEVYLANVLDLEARVLVGSMTDSCRVRKGGERGVWVVPRLVGSKKGTKVKTSTRKKRDEGPCQRRALGVYT